MKLKQIITGIVLSMVGIFSLTACAKQEPNNLLQNASPETSALSFYQYSDETSARYIIYDTRTVEQIIDQLSQITAKEVNDWSYDKITYPIYGLEIGGKDGYSVEVAWSNGYWIAQDGSVYRYEFDFSKLLDQYDWEQLDGTMDLTYFPCASRLLKDERGWNQKILSLAPKLDAPEGITAKLESRNDDTLTVTYTNHSGKEWVYGTYYYLQVLLDDSWYRIPMEGSNWGFNDIAYIVSEDTTSEQTYHLDPYGTLPPGNYQLVAYELTVDFTIE